MAEYLNMSAKQVIIRCVLAGSAFLVHSLLLAQALTDPTRPPSALGRAGEIQEQASSAEPVLQSVLISSVRMEAIISGRTVRVGDRVGEAKVVKIAENEVVLRNGNASQTLKLYPNLKKPVSLQRNEVNGEKRRQ